MSTQRPLTPSSRSSPYRRICNVQVFYARKPARRRVLRLLRQLYGDVHRDLQRELYRNLYGRLLRLLGLFKLFGVLLWRVLWLLRLRRRVHIVLLWSELRNL